MLTDILFLPLQCEGDQWNLVPNNSTTLFLLVLQDIAIRLSRTFDIKLDQFKRNHPGGGIGEEVDKR